MYEHTLFKNITKMEEKDISFELDATRCNCDLENCTETCEKAYDCFHGICVCSDYSIDLPERMCHLRRKFKVDTTTLNSMVTLKKLHKKECYFKYPCEKLFQTHFINSFSSLQFEN